jgi:Family of unknown function (DUF6298)
MQSNTTRVRSLFSLRQQPLTIPLKYTLQSRQRIVVSVLSAALLAISCNACTVLELSRGPTSPTLRAHPHPLNPRYFTDGSGNVIYLTGAHTWANLQDHGRTDPPPAFDFPGYLDFLQQYHLNFIRLWMWEQANGSPAVAGDYRFSPLPYARVGPGTALDGKLRFDLTKFNQVYFERLRSRIEEAWRRGIYVSIMLFQGWSIEQKRPYAIEGNPWLGHPFNRKNNINGVDGDTNGDGEGPEVHTLQNPVITALQETYVRRVIDTVNDVDNIIYEIANESTPGSDAWQVHMIKAIHTYEATKPKQHPVLYTAPWGYSELWASPAEAISPGWEGSTGMVVPYRDDPPANDGRKIIINDTDHLWGIGGDRAWVWKSFLRGLHPIYMDPYDERLTSSNLEKASANREDTLRAMGHTRSFAERINLARMVPRSDLCSSTYCLVSPGQEYLVYIPTSKQSTEFNEQVTVDLTSSRRGLRVEWFHPETGEATVAHMTTEGGEQTFTAPFGGDAVLYLAYAP